MSSAALARALSYPFGIPAGSFRLEGGRAVALDGADLSGRIAVLAFGANAAPEALVRKLGERAADSSIPVLAAELHDFDVVHSAHVSSYGSIPATLQPCRGATASVHVMHLRADELAAVHRSEPNYVFARLRGIALSLEDGTRHDSAHAYVSRHGCLRLDGAPVGVAAVRVRGRRWPALDQPSILAAARDRLSPGEGLEEFVLAQASDPEVAAVRTATVRGDAIPFAWTDWEEVAR